MKISQEKKQAEMQISVSEHSAKAKGANDVVIKKGYSPYISARGTWMVYDDTEKAFVDTNIKAQGPEGRPGSPGTPGSPGSPGAPGTPGEKGDPFTYADFTAEQLEALKGPKGDNYIITDADYEAIAKKVPAGSTTWEAVQGKPDTFTPSRHTHNASEVTDAARHTHSNKAILDGITKAPLTEHQSLDECVKTNDARLTDARTPKSHTHAKSDISDFPTIPTVPTAEISANTAARHSHSNKSILDGITKAPLTEHQSLDNCVKTNDARLTDARTPKAHGHNVSDIEGITSIALAQIGTSDSYLRVTDDEITYKIDNIRKSGKLPLQDDIPTDAHINSLIDAKLGVIENGSY